MRGVGATGTLLSVERDEAITLLPSAYAIALQLADQGAAREVIARDAGVEPEAVEALLALAHAKLTALLTERP